MRMTFKVTYDDGREVEAVAKPKDIVAFERQYNRSFAMFGEDDTPFEHVYYLAWSPLHRQGREPRAFDEFLSDVDEVEAVKGQEGETAPFPSGPSDESPAG